MIQRTRNQSIMLSLPSNQSANHAILAFQPTPSIPLLQQYIISVPYLDAYSSTISRARSAKYCFFFLLVLFLNGIIATRGKAMLPTLPQKEKGAAFFPPKMPVPPSGPSKQHNSVPRLRFIPATVVYGSKRLVPSGASPLHHYSSGGVICIAIMNKCTNTKNEQTSPLLYVGSFHNVFFLIKKRAPVSVT
ncbi:LOW QUALITY PROTEIN: uncharacterized mitochondrial protein AtMg00170/AtMg00620-like [Mercurialis annua]|uniref:LOW QUALITY PROTEIN: uncharacterized mitochondrial protein AtMg00170/AtMg00620-like n=1 Tax=Mercurialis annua TaxID=3986 RepID=UPI00215E57EB|nr:LOW QUALITY PROTEIN: uncharacterized mitochondrial protein AtMg00170/AtMg00620-like [Mercurialis annua]